MTMNDKIKYLLVSFVIILIIILFIWIYKKFISSNDMSGGKEEDKEMDFNAIVVSKDHKKNVNEDNEDQTSQSNKNSCQKTCSLTCGDGVPCPPPECQKCLC